MVYSVEQLYQFFKVMKPNYFAVYNDKGHKVLSTAHVEGLTVEKGEKNKADNSEKLWEIFNLWVNGDDAQGFHGLISGKYKLDLRPNETSGKSANHYWFGVGDWESNSKIGSTQPQVNNMAAMGNQNGLVSMLFQSMQQNQALMMGLMEKSFQNSQELNKAIAQKEMDMFKLQNEKPNTFYDKIGNAIEKHLPAIINGITRQQATAVGKVVAPFGAVVQTEIEPDPTPPVKAEVSPELQEQIENLKRINAVLAQIQEKYPDNNPLDMLELGLNTFLTENPTENAAI